MTRLESQDCVTRVESQDCVTQVESQDCVTRVESQDCVTRVESSPQKDLPLESTRDRVFDSIESLTRLVTTLNNNNKNLYQNEQMIQIVRFCYQTQGQHIP